MLIGFVLPVYIVGDPSSQPGTSAISFAESLVGVSANRSKLERLVSSKDHELPCFCRTRVQSSLAITLTRLSLASR